MSHRGKRPSRSENDGPPPIKRRKGRPPISGGAATNDDDEANTIHAKSSSKLTQTSGSGVGTSTSKNWQLRQMTDLKISSIYNRNAPEAPAELFRKDLISAMKLPDSEPLAHDEYWVIADQWKQEWERGVQVPVNPDSLPEPSVRFIQSSSIYKGRSDFKLPKNKYIRITKDESFSSELHYLSNAPAMADAACSYDLDQCDEAWLKLTNGERVQCGLSPVTEEQFERVVEELETRCWDKIQAIMKSEEGLGIEYDENVICDVCRSPDSEEANEMVFCDNCNICVHQACYGITVIPPGQWMCRTCNVGQRPDCVLCPNKGGAMKSTRSGQKWAHVSCALWIPEVSIGSVDRMEPITKISSIPQSRWALLCVLCRERVGACIQCSVKTCKTAYHVTCAFQHGLEMRAIIEDEHAEDGVKLRSYCLKHSMNKSKRDKSGNSCNAAASGSDDDDVKRKKQRKDMTTEERNQARIQRLQEVEADFDKHVNVKDISCHLLEVDQEGIHTIYNYWILKRKSMNNRPLLPPKSEDVDMATHKQGQADVEKMKMFVHLRQDLERVRNLCYMVSRREKLSRSFFKMREQTFHKQMSLLMDMKPKKADDTLVQAVLQANHGPSIYDRLYSARQVAVVSQEKWDQLVNRLAESTSLVVDEVKSTKVSGVDLNGVNRDGKTRHGKQSKKTVFNGATARRASTYVSSLSSDTESSTGRMIREISAAAMTKKAARTSKNAESTKIDRRKRRVNSTTAVKSKSLVETSSEDDETVNKVEKQRSPRNRTLRQMAREMSNDKSRLSSASDESDELLPIRNSGSHMATKEQRGKMSAIYSDSDSTDKDKTDNGASDSQQHVVRTKAAMKEFVPQKGTKGDSKSLASAEDTPVNRDKSRDKGKTSGKPAKQDNSNKVNTKSFASSKKEFHTDLLVVPQRQAAKKASENMKSTGLYTTAPAVVAGEKMKKDAKEAPAKEPPEPVVSVKERRDSILSPSKDERKSTGKGKTPKSQSTTPKVITGAKEKSAEVENRELLEKLAYVPQRQAAKKAAEHIKSGLGKPTEAAATVEDAKPTKTQQVHAVTKKGTEESKKNVTPVVISSSSSSYTGSSTSSSSSSSSSSESEEEHPKSKSKVLTQPSPVKDVRSGSAPVNNRSRDLPFLDKDIKSLRSVSSSDSSDSESESTDESSESASNNNNRNSVKKAASSGGGARVVPERKLKTSGLGRPGAGSSGGAIAKDDGAQAKGGSAKAPPRGGKRSSVSSDRRRSADTDKQGAPDKIPELQGEATGGRRRKSSATSPRTSVAAGETGKLLQKQRTEDEVTTTKSLKSDELSPEKRKANEKLKATINTKESPCAKRLEPTSSVERRKSRTPSEENNKVQQQKFKSPERKARELPKPSPQRDESAIANVKSRSVTPTKRDTPSPLKSRGGSVAAEEIPVVLSPYNKQSTPVEAKVEVSSDSITREGENRPATSTLEKTVQKSIFSPLSQTPTSAPPPLPPTSAKNKDPCAFFDFTDDLLPGVTETINDDTFNVQPDGAENMRTVGLGVPFSHTTDILFKEDYKEDSEKETMNLVEKLRQKFKRTHSTTSSAPSDSGNQEQKVPQMQESLEIVENKVNDVSPMRNVDITSKRLSPEAEKVSAEVANFQVSKFDMVASGGQSLQMPKVSESSGIVDHVSPNPVDERWAPPSELTPASVAHPSQMMFDPKMMSQNLVQATMEEIVSQSLVAAAGNNADFLKQFQERMEFQTSQCIAAQQQLHQQQTVITSEAHQPPPAKPVTPHPKPMEYDDASIQSPYSVHPSNWVESDMMPNRRSVSSSPASSVSEHETKNQPRATPQPPENVMGNQLSVHHSAHRNLLADMPQFMNMQHPSMQPFPPVSTAPATHNATPLDTMMPPFNYAESTGGFTGPVTLFPPSGLNVQLPIPSPGAAMFPPAFGQSFTTTPNSQPLGLLQKPDDILSVTNTIPSYPSNPCGAAFTSSSQNMALTAAMVSPTPAPISITSPQPTTQQMPVDRRSFSASNLSQQPSTGETRTEKSSEIDVMKSPSKPSRQSTRYGGQTKSPAKSPAKSPRQQQPIDVNRQLPVNKVVKTADTAAKVKKVRNATTPGRGRGRGRGRGGKAMHHFPQLGVPEFDFMTGGTNHSKLAGTVYDFDDEIAGESVENLKAMRDRRRSIDCRVESFRSTRDVNTSPKFASPNAHSKQTRTIPPPPPFTTADIRNLRPPSPVRTDTRVAQVTPTTSLRDIVQPVLPGPVDMRTYSTGFDASSDAFNNHLLRAFASGTADQTLADIDEEMEKELQSALKASSTKPKSPTVKVTDSQPVQAPEEFLSELDTSKPKVSLSDSRNQLKLKIKGPLAHPDNYNSQTTAVRHPVVGQIGPGIDSTFPTTSTNCTLSSMATPGSSNFHRMRKKELLRQYCSQDMNTVDAHVGLPSGVEPTAMIHNTQMSRSVGIPKAVDSMSSIPTKEDYKDYATLDPKKRKKVGGMSRELRQLDISSYEMNDEDMGRIPFDIGADGTPSKRRMRGNSNANSKDLTETSSAALSAPKLKIKIGHGVIDVSPPVDKRLSGRPPKKRLSQNMAVPSVEDIKRDCMNFRKLVMADFEEKEKVTKPKKVKPSKEEKRKKKKDKKHKFEIINNGNSDAAPKLIIRLGKRKSEDGGPAQMAEPQIPQDPYEYDPNAVDPLAIDEPMMGKKCSSANGAEKLITPIRLKISRSNQGKSYVMSEEGKKTDKAAGHPCDGAQVNCTDAKVKKTKEAELNLDASKTSDGGGKASVGDNGKLANPGNGERAKKGGGDGGKSGEKESSVKMDEKSKKTDAKETDSSGTTKGCPPLPLNKDCEVR